MRDDGWCFALTTLNAPGTQEDAATACASVHFPSGPVPGRRAADQALARVEDPLVRGERMSLARNTKRGVSGMSSSRPGAGPCAYAAASASLCGGARCEPLGRLRGGREPRPCGGPPLRTCAWASPRPPRSACSMPNRFWRIARTCSKRSVAGSARTDFSFY